ncbi:MAG TPA: hypothetical protein PLE09_05885 [Caldisericia bacterium]|jgi:hypothetical protein|nr:hypothetical protein [Caldisericia bacterium]
MRNNGQIRYCKVAVCLLLFFICSNCSFPKPQPAQKTPRQMPAFPMENSRVVEVCVSQEDKNYSFPGLVLEKEDSITNFLLYEIFISDDSEGDLTPHSYGSKYFRKWTRSMNDDDVRLPRTVLQRDMVKFHTHRDNKGVFNGSLWMQDTLQEIEKYSIDNRFVIESYDVHVKDEEYIVSITLRCTEDIPQEEWNHLCYNLFLKPDVIVKDGGITFDRYNRGTHKSKISIVNLLYDFIPIHKDNKFDYDGIGFPLNNHQTIAPSIDNSLVVLTTEPFRLPLIPYEESLANDIPYIRQPYWSLHLFLNDDTDLWKNLYSWSIPIEIEQVFNLSEIK